MKRIYFFSTPVDAAHLLSAFEDAFPVKYIKYGQSESPNPPIHLSSNQIPSAGIASETTGSSSISYLVSSRESINNMERFVNSTGQTRWLIDNGNNDGSVVLTLAGLWGSDVLLPGNMSTLHETKPAQQLMRRFQSALKKSGFVKIDMWWVGAEALEMLKTGKRLATAAVESPPNTTCHCRITCETVEHNLIDRRNAGAQLRASGSWARHPPRTRAACPSAS